MKLHILKIKIEYFAGIINCAKAFELRKNDRDYQVNDLIHFVDETGNEFDYLQKEVYQITYVLNNVEQYGLDKDYCILSIKRLEAKQ